METPILIDDDPELNAEVLDTMRQSMIAHWASMGIKLVYKPVSSKGQDPVVNAQYDIRNTHYGHHI